MEKSKDWILLLPTVHQQIKVIDNFRLSIGTWRSFTISDCPLRTHEGHCLANAWILLILIESRLSQKKIDIKFVELHNVFKKLLQSKKGVQFFKRRLPCIKCFFFINLCMINKFLSYIKLGLAWVGGPIFSTPPKI